MLASLSIRFKISVQEVWEEKNLQDYKHDKQLNKNHNPNLFPPFTHIPKSFKIKMENFCENIWFHTSLYVLIVKNNVLTTLLKPLKYRHLISFFTLNTTTCVKNHYENRTSRKKRNIFITF